MELMMSSIPIAEKLKVFAIGGFFGFFLFSILTTSDFHRVNQIFTARTIGYGASTTDKYSSPPSSPIVVDQSAIDSTAIALATTADQRAHSKLITSSTPILEKSNILPQILVHSKTTTSLNESTSTSAISEKDHDSTTDDSNSSEANTPIICPPSTRLVSDGSSTSSIMLIKQPSTQNSDQLDSYGDHNAAEATSETKRRKSTCNIFDGKWVYKPNESPVYDADECPLLTVGTSCKKNGRPDSEYLGWNWQPNHCDIPLFNGTDMLERLRGKKMILVGDSINHNQWMSLACLIYTSIPPSRRQFVQFKPGKFFFIVKDYDFTMEFHMSAFLVHIDYKHPNGRRVLHLDTMDPMSTRWLDADIIVFNSAHWWDHPVSIRQWDVVEYKGKLIEDMPKELAYGHALTTWSRWVAKKVNPNKTSVFFRSNSPAHNGKQWCFKITRPIMDDSFFSFYPRSMVEVAERSIARLSQRFPVTYLNVTWLSGYRRDAHPSVYINERSKLKELLKEKGSLDMVAKRNSDCSHWCLPGLPDTWNRLLYASMFFVG